METRQPKSFPSASHIISAYGSQKLDHFHCQNWPPYMAYDLDSLIEEVQQQYVVTGHWDYELQNPDAAYQQACRDTIQHDGADVEWLISHKDYILSDPLRHAIISFYTYNGDVILNGILRAKTDQEIDKFRQSFNQALEDEGLSGQANWNIAVLNAKHSSTPFPEISPHRQPIAYLPYSKQLQLYVNTLGVNPLILEQPTPNNAYTWWERLTLEQWFFIMNYLAKTLDEIIHAAPKLQKRLLVWRGVKTDKGVNFEQPFHTTGFFSTSLIWSNALFFAIPEEEENELKEQMYESDPFGPEIEVTIPGYVMRIYLAVDTPCLFIDRAVSKGGGRENEILLPTNICFNRSGDVKDTVLPWFNFRITSKLATLSTCA